MDAERVVGGGVVFVAALLIVLAAYSVIQSIRSNGETDYCYVEMWSPPQMAPQWMLQAHRPWRSDRQIGVYQTIEEAKQKADSMSCKLNAK